MADVAVSGTDARFVLVRDEPDLCRVIRERCAELQITYDTLDTAALLPDRYASKLLSEHPTKHMGALALWNILGTLGYRIGLVHDEELLSHFRGKLVVRERPPQAQAKRRLTISLTRDFLRKIGHKGGKRRAAIAREKKRRSDIYRRNALKRWMKPTISESEAGSVTPPR